MKPTMSNTSVDVRVPGKINLVLRSSARRADGYHELATVFQAVDVYDELRAEPGAPGQFDVRVLGEQAHRVPAGPDNLAAKAARLLASTTPDPLGCSLTIRKTIPVGGGMAGGSADAAAALVACAALWGLDVPAADLLRLGAELGADVPFCLFGGTALGRNRGDDLTPLPVHGTFHWVLALSDHGLSTPAVFERFDELTPQAGSATPMRAELLDALASGDAAALGAELANDLADAALSLRPQLQATIAAGRAGGALGHVISGSGPTVAFLAPDADAAAALAAHLADAGVADAVRVATGPVAGAVIIER